MGFALSRYDVIVVGARCAGSPTAMLLARAGHRVLLLDKARFPSDIGRLFFIHQTGVALLARWGLLDRIAASGCPPIVQTTNGAGGMLLVGSTAPIDGVVEAYAPRRKVLDTILARAAAESGAELREGFVVEEVLTEGDRVTGVRGRTRGGPTVTEHARVVVGADGMRSIVARTVEAPVYAAQPVLCCYYFSYWSGVPMAGLEVYRGDRVAIFCAPTHDDLVCSSTGWPRDELPALRRDVEGSVMRAFEQAPTLVERVRAARREERFGGMADLPNFFRRPFGPGWALVGDAGYHKDPYMAHGISDAFADAALLAEALDDGLTGRRSFESALGDYERARNQRVTEYYKLNCRLARLEPPTPNELALRAALRDNPEATSRFFGVTAGTVPVAEFFARENIEAIVRGAIRS